MLVQSFFELMETASVSERAEAVKTLAWAYFAGALGENTPEEFQAALASVLDDPAPLVRKALALALAEEAQAPRALVLSLAHDQPEVSAVLIARSSVLAEADLVDLAGSVERIALAGIALRPEVSGHVAAAVAARGNRDTTLLLLRNPSATLFPSTLFSIARHFGADAPLREALLARPDLPAEARHLLLCAVSEALGAFVERGGFSSGLRLKRARAEAVEAGTLTIAAGAGKGLEALVAHLRGSANLTPALLLRATLHGDVAFMAATLALLCDLPLARVETLIGGGSASSIGALARKAGLPEFLIPALVAGLSRAIRLPAAERGRGMNLSVIRAAQSAIIGTAGEESLRLLALLRRHEADAARAQARALAETLRARPPHAEALPALLAPRQAEELLRLTCFEGEGELSVEAQENVAMPAEDPVELLPADASTVPDLAALIAEWKAEQGLGAGRLDFSPLNENAGARKEKAA